MLIFFLLFSCSSPVIDTFNSKELISSKGEKIYINSLNWGATDDNQITAISSNKEKVKERSDTLEAVKGVEPFIYSFKNDSLKLFFHNEIIFEVKENFKTIHVIYIVLRAKEYNNIRQKAYNNDEYHSVPIREKKVSPSDMPKSPSK